MGKTTPQKKTGNIERENSQTDSAGEVELESQNQNDNLNDSQLSINSNDNNPHSKQTKHKTRQDNSLSVLTKKFVEIIKKADNCTIDLNDTVKHLKVQKRRIYDITNVLQGIGYVQKVHKNQIKWIGSTQDPQMEQQIINLRLQLDEMNRHQKKLERYLQLLNEKIKDQYLNNDQKQQYNYLTHKDCKQLGEMVYNESKQMLVVVRAPKGSSLQTGQLKKEKKITFVSNGGQIEVYLCKKGEEVVRVQGRSPDE